MRALHTVVPALKIPSDYVRAFDTLTPKSGDTVLIAMRMVTGGNGRILSCLLGLPCLAADAAPVGPVAAGRGAAKSDLDLRLSDLLGTKAVKSKLEYDQLILGDHRPQKIADKLLQLEKRYMFSPGESRCTKSHDVADGALIGPASSNIGSV